MNIGCYLVSKGKLVRAFIPEELLIELVIKLRTDGEEVVGFKDKEILAEGIYIPAKGSNTNIMVLPGMECE